MPLGARLSGKAERCGGAHVRGHRLAPGIRPQRPAAAWPAGLFRFRHRQLRGTADQGQACLLRCPAGAPWRDARALLGVRGCAVRHGVGQSLRPAGLRHRGWLPAGRPGGDQGAGGCDHTGLCGIDAELMVRGFINETDYSITYFGGSNTKSTNNFRDYTGVILLGDWNTPESFASSVRKAFGTETSIEEYRLWYYTQLLCRIGIRDLSGGTFEVYYSDDYKQDFIDKLSLYLNNNTYTPPKLKRTKKGWFDDMAKEAKIRNNLKVEIEKLALIDIGLKDAILLKKHYTLTITLKEISRYCPRKEKKRRNYDSLIKACGKIGITLDIT